MKTILITGGTGFLGSKIVSLILKKGHKVIILIRKNSSLERIKNELGNKRLILFSTENHINDCFIKHKIDFIIHTATCYGRNNEARSEIADANLLLPLNLILCAEKYGVDGFINSDTFFNEKINFEKKESIYVETKKNFLTIAKIILPNLKIKFINMKIEQIYGPNDSTEKFVPFIIKELLSQKISIDLTLGKQRRDFVYSEDVAGSYLNVINYFKILNSYEQFNIGTGESIEIGRVVKRLKKLTQSKSILNFGKLKYRKNEIMDSFADIKNNEKIHWKTRVSLESGLIKTINHFKHE